ncbi:hypothetical protein [Chitinophaga niabensis]|uniref:Por secretion system C-terminal sorting domain-containing protein n=1 Tax=Chitinophaga niabensis TaxID=536979 RepID=A0A1N6JWX6_9BACT|nr:hypothetical protein [Chitinophaga niabensis]SIO48647.1 hypothetical protein SAMN04488055_4574 [Chitinophaga niabensis]
MKRRYLSGIMILCACLALLILPFAKNANSATVFNNFTVAVKPGYSAPPGQFYVKVKDISTGTVIYTSPVFGGFGGTALPFGTTIPDGEYAVEVIAQFIIKASSNGDERTVTGSETWIASGGATPISILVRPN